MVDVLAVFQKPLLRLLDGEPLVAHVGGIIDQHSVARGAAKRVHDKELPLGILLAKLRGGAFGVHGGLRHAGPERDVQHVSALKKLLKELQIAKLVDLRGRGELSGVEEAVKPGKRLRVLKHVVHIRLAVNAVGVKENGNVASADIGIRKIDRGFTG